MIRRLHKCRCNLRLRPKETPMREPKPEPLETDLSLEKTLYGKPTPEFLAEMRRLEKAATPGPWQSMRDGNQYIDPLGPTAECVGASRLVPVVRPWNPYAYVRFGFKPDELEKPRFLDADADLIAAARNALPALLDHIETLTAERDAMGQKWGVDLVAMAKERNEWADRAEKAEADLQLLNEMRTRAEAAEAELAAERGRREAADIDLAQMTLARDELAAKLTEVRAVRDEARCVDAHMLPDVVDIDGRIDAKGVQYVGQARRQTDGTWRTLANVGGALCLVECAVVVPSCGGERVALLERIAKAADECLDVITEFADYPNAWSEAFQSLGDLLAKRNPREVMPEPEKPSDEPKSICGRYESEGRVFFCALPEYHAGPHRLRIMK